MKNVLVRRMLGLVLDHRSSDTSTVGFIGIEPNLHHFEIDHDQKTPAQITDELWREVATNSTHLSEYERLFSLAKVL